MNLPFTPEEVRALMAKHGMTAKRPLTSKEQKAVKNRCWREDRRKREQSK